MKQSRALSLTALFVGLIVGGVAYGMFPGMALWFAGVIAAAVWTGLYRAMLRSEADRRIVDRDW